MEYRGMQYAIRTRIERDEYVAIHPDDVEIPGKVVAGSREKAELEAHHMITTGSEDIPANIRSSNERAERSAMSLALKLDRARQNLEYWRKLEEDPKLPRPEAQIARNLVRSYQAAVAYYEQAFAYRERDAQERTRRTLR
jgi:hypothetical protein